MAEQISEQQLTQWEKWGIHNQRELSGLVRAYRAQQQTIKAYERCIAAQAEQSNKQADKIRAQAEEIRLLRQCNATDQQMEIIKLKEEIDDHLTTISTLSKEYTAMCAEIERLKARGVTPKELSHALFCRQVFLLLRKKGLLIEDNAQPMQEPQRKPTRAEVEDELVRMVDDLWDVGLTPTKIAKVITHHLISKGMVEDAPKPIQHWRDGGKACDIEQPTEQVAWPKLPDYLSPSVEAEFARIRTALGVKEVE